MADIYLAAMNDDRVDTSLIEAVLFRRNSFPALFRYYGLYSLNPNMAAAYGSLTSSPPNELELEPRESVKFSNARVEDTFIEYCEKLISFVQKIARKCPGTHYHDVYSAYPELFFIFVNDIETEYLEKDDLIEQLTSDFFAILFQEVRDTDNHRPDSRVREFFIDYETGLAKIMFSRPIRTRDRSRTSSVGNYQ
ncbi:hypothetical protein [Halostagnicola sp. A56]|uniref:hypothetical protein n=1 Tax=Halostagnicola sp. A56 TaxID=1495067 RepID=UPI0012E233E2|nr:hypothetical protein [Halostagnicola sp. A56]